MQVEVENTVVNERLYPHKYITPVIYKPECDCGDEAKLKVNGQYRCWECAEDEGIVKL